MMASKFTLKLDKREITGRKIKKLRREGIVPANIFGNKIASLAVQVPLLDFNKVYEQAGETSIIYATVSDESKERPLLISALQVHPVTGAPLHIDFHQVNLTEKATATVPLVLVGESPAVVDKAAVLVQMVDELEIEALPTDFPSQIELDISSLKEFNDSLSVKDIKVDSKLEVQDDPEEIVVQVSEPKEEEPEPVVEAEAVEGAEAATPATPAEAAETPAEKAE